MTNIWYAMISWQLKACSLKASLHIAS